MSKILGAGAGLASLVGLGLVTYLMISHGNDPAYYEIYSRLLFFSGIILLLGYGLAEV